MLNLHHYTEKEQKQLLKSLVILRDSREQENSHLTSYFDRKGIVHEEFKLDFGDYSVKLPASPDLGISRDLYFNGEIVIERKAHLEEISSNLAGGRERFKDEFIRAGSCRKILLIERGSWDDILAGNYKTDLSPASFYASLLSFQQRYSLQIAFVSKANSGAFIHGALYYYIRQLVS